MHSDENDKGTPQGGVMFPLLSNIALHGMEESVLKHCKRDEVKLIRYANDFVIFSKEIESVKKAQEIIKKFLAEAGLKLSEEKTRIGHTVEAKDGTTGMVGLDFLGYYFRNLTRTTYRKVKST